MPQTMTLTESYLVAGACLEDDALVSELGYTFFVPFFWGTGSRKGGSM